MPLPPHGGTLVDRLMTPEEARALAARAREMPRLTLNNREASDLRMIATGAFSPLTGFMSRADYDGVVKNAHLSSGLPWTIPVTLSTDRHQADELREGMEIALFDQDHALLGSMKLREKYAYDRQFEATQVFRTADQAHPGVANLFAQGDVLLGGDTKAVPFKPAGSYTELQRNPAQTRAAIEERGWR